MRWKRGRIWWYRFKFGGRVFEESTHTANKRLAERIETKRRRDLEEGLHGLKKRVAPVLFRVAAREWLDWKKPTLSARTVELHELCLKRLNEHFGNLLLTDVTAEDVSQYQKARLKAGRAPKTVNLEVGSLRGVLRKNRLWAALAEDVRQLPARSTVGRCLTADEETRLLGECTKSRSRALYPFVKVALATGCRYNELRLLRWQQVDFIGKTLTVGHAKTTAGTGRVIPLCEVAFKVLTTWAQQFSERQPEHFVFGRESYGLAGNDRTVATYATDPTEPVGSLQGAWKAAKKRAKIAVRLHDTRHTWVTRLLEHGVSLPVVAELAGWSGATMALMAKRYGHVGESAKRQALALLDPPAAPVPPAETTAAAPPATVN